MKKYKYLLIDKIFFVIANHGAKEKIKTIVEFG